MFDPRDAPCVDLMRRSGDGERESAGSRGASQRDKWVEGKSAHVFGETDFFPLSEEVNQVENRSVVEQPA
jgi:hypothetical protein